MLLRHCSGLAENEPDPRQACRGNSSTAAGTYWEEAGKRPHLLSGAALAPAALVAKFSRRDTHAQTQTHTCRHACMHICAHTRAKHLQTYSRQHWTPICPQPCPSNPRFQHSLLAWPQVPQWLPKPLPKEQCAANALPTLPK